MEAIELFCGAGGTSYGAEVAGARVRLGLDIAPDAVATFQLNHPNAKGLAKPVEDIRGTDLLREANLHTLDLLIGGPSCQGYSTIGKRLDDDPRNTLYTHYLRIVRETRPKWLFFENVKGMLISNKGLFFRDFTSALVDLGYDVVGTVANAADYGVPQRRERLIVIGNRIGIEPSFPAPTHEDPRCRHCSRPDASNRVRNSCRRQSCPHCSGTGQEPVAHMRLPAWVNLKDAIGDLPWLEDFGGTDDLVPYSGLASSIYQKRMRKGARGYTHHKAKHISAFAESIVSKISPGQGIRSIPEDELPGRFKEMRRVKNGNFRRDCTTLYHRLAWDMPSYTITCYFTNVSSGAFTHPMVTRSLTIREAARLQSFPDRFKFAPGDIRRQIGNAVPPLLAERVVKHIISLDANKHVSCLKGERHVVGKPLGSLVANQIQLFVSG